MISNEDFVRLNNMIETMNEQNVMFQNYLRENHLSNETELSLSSARPKVSLCDDNELSFPLEFNFVVDMALIDLEKVIDAPLISLLLVAPSSVNTPRDIVEGVLTLPNSLIPLA